MTNPKLKERLDTFWWNDVNKKRWDSEDNLRKFLAIICEILEIPKCTIYKCSADRFHNCTLENGGERKCGGACYHPAEKCIFYLDHIGLSLVLEELFHHIDATNQHNAMYKIMMAWYESLNQKKGFAKYFGKENVGKK